MCLSIPFFIFFFNLVSINWMEWLTTPACPSLMCSFKRGNVEETNSSEICVWCLCMYVSCLWSDWYCGVTWQSEKSLEMFICLWPQFDCPEVTMCGWQDIKIQLLLLLLYLIITINRFYVVLFSALEQTHCACMWFYMSEQLFIVRFWISTDVVYLQHWHGWCHMKLLTYLYTTPVSDIIANNSVNNQLFADDTQLQKSAHLTKELSACTDDLKTRMTENRLKLNDDKTEALLFPLCFPWNLLPFPSLTLLLLALTTSPSVILPGTLDSFLTQNCPWRSTS